MVNIVGIHFKNADKIYYFDPENQFYQKGEKVIVETVRGVEMGEVVLSNRMVPRESVVMPLNPIMRKAEKKDFKQLAENEKLEKEAFDVCNAKVKEHGLDMKLIDVKCTFDCSKILFYFTADGRVDFRELVKSLAAVFKTRIELRQIGVRDEAKMLGGMGVCGMELCCRRFLDSFQPVSIKMAKEQGLSLNPAKISGTCGRLMCCLKYEQETYEHLLKYTPKIGAIVQTPDGKGTVVETNLLTGKIKVNLKKNDDSVNHIYDVKDLVIIKDADIKLTPEEVKELGKLEDDK
ncbi:MAG: stage 0 sporulation family protein [Firmicutes bacterium]|nr:stage 0 sporulation family protein [Bacillota bacterium]